MRNYFKKRLPWFKVMALAYCHLPIVLFFCLFDGRAVWKWYLIVGLVPWMGMAFPFILLVLSVFTIISLQFTSEGMVFSEVHRLIPIVGSLLIFSYFYWHLINDVIKSDGLNIKNISFLIAWSLFFNFLELMFIPRSFIG